MIINNKKKDVHYSLIKGIFHKENRKICTLQFLLNCALELTVPILKQAFTPKAIFIKFHYLYFRIDSSKIETNLKQYLLKKLYLL